MAPLILSPIFLLLSSIALLISANRLTGTLTISSPFFWLLALVIYLTIHGLSLNNFNLFHYYWLSVVIFSIIVLHINKEAKEKLKIIFYAAVFLLGIFECLIIFLQLVKIIPSYNVFFDATGTWTNPNVVAIFLPFSHLAFLALQENRKTRLAKLLFPTLFIVTILVLKSRTAILIELLLITYFYFIPFLKTKIPSRKLIAISITTVIALLSILALSFKKQSTIGRSIVLENCFSVITSDSDFWGKGLGMFEKTYNIYVAENKLETKGYIFMAYNDFVELFIEGGIIAVVLWSAFIFFLLKNYAKNKFILLPTIFILITQLLNFVFQAIPIFIVGLLFIALNIEILSKPQNSNLLYTFSKVIFIGITMLLLIQLTKIAYNFYTFNNTDINQTSSLKKLETLKTDLHFSSLFHKKIAYSYLKNNNRDNAISHFSNALHYTADPQLFFALGKAYEEKGNCDSAKIFYNYAHLIMPNAKAYLKASQIDCTTQKFVK